MTERSTPAGFGGRHVWSVSDDAVSLVRPVVPPCPYRVMAEPKPLVVDLARSALVVIDMQNDFLHDEGWFAGKGVDPAPLRATIGPINALAVHLRGLDVPIVWLNWGVREDRLNLPPGLAHSGKRWPEERGYGEDGPFDHGGALVRGSWGAKSYAELDVDDADVRIDKSRFGGFTDSDFDGVLRNLGIHTLLFAGINIDRCVFATLTEASFRGYDVVLVTDAVATPSPQACTEAVHFLVDKLYGFRVRTNAVLGGTSISK
ncbi:MAG: cysteine hydrolase [Alphaproteobacteria bacterium]|nr:cysteine hydrolase [Alphaproteobacteria bacterium]